MVFLGGSSAGMHTVLALCARFAVAHWPLLILGEPGTGKSALAQHIHTLSGRPGEFIKHSLGSHLNKMAYEALAGHAEGSYTDAKGSRKGLVEEAHRGTLFLDEISSADGRVQDMLLELFDDHQLRRIGENRARPVEVRLILATNADLREEVQAGRFRRDLLDRIGYLKLTVPPLRERREDILSLARHFLKHEAWPFPGYGPELSPEVREFFLTWPWPDNVRGLENVIRHAILMAHPAPVIGLEHLPPELIPKAMSGSVMPSAEAVAAMLELVGGNKAEAARRLGISRSHLYAIMRRANERPSRGAS